MTSGLSTVTHCWPLNACFSFGRWHTNSLSGPRTTSSPARTTPLHTFFTRTSAVVTLGLWIIPRTRGHGPLPSRLMATDRPPRFPLTLHRPARHTLCTPHTPKHHLPIRPLRHRLPSSSTFFTFPSCFFFTAFLFLPGAVVLLPRCQCSARGATPCCPLPLLHRFRDLSPPPRRQLQHLHCYFFCVVCVLPLFWARLSAHSSLLTRREYSFRAGLRGLVAAAAPLAFLFSVLPFPYAILPFPCLLVSLPLAFGPLLCLSPSAVSRSPSNTLFLSGASVPLSVL